MNKPELTKEQSERADKLADAATSILDTVTVDIKAAMKDLQMTENERYVFMYGLSLLFKERMQVNSLVSMLEEIERELSNRKT